jgi:tetratricopeptide (TPR) repeat protein
VHLRRGDHSKAFLLAQRWLQTYAAADLPMPQLVMAASLGEVFNAMDHIDDALALFDRACQFVESKSVFGWGPRVLALLGDAYGHAGRIDEAVATGQRALDLARQLQQRSDEAHALYFLGNIQSYGASTNANQAREYYQQALVLAHELGMRPLKAQCHSALGELAGKTGDRQEAQQQLTVAITMFRDMGMQTWPERAESALRAL